MADFNPLPNPYDKQTPNGVYWSITDVAQKYGGSGILCPSKLKDTAAIDVRVDLTQLPAGKKKEIEDKMAGSALTLAPAAVSAPASMDISSASTASSSASVSSTPAPAPGSYPLPSPMAAEAPGSYPLPSPIAAEAPGSSPAAPKVGGASSFEALAAALAQITLPSHVRFLQVSSAGPTTVTTQTGGRSRRRQKHKSRQRKTRHRRRY